jgi:hypothetical protein
MKSIGLSNSSKQPAPTTQGLADTVELYLAASITNDYRDEVRLNRVLFDSGTRRTASSVCA